jgi:hypothetical protein
LDRNESGDEGARKKSVKSHSGDQLEEIDLDEKLVWEDHFTQKDAAQDQRPDEFDGTGQERDVNVMDRNQRIGQFEGQTREGHTGQPNL